MYLATELGYKPLRQWIAKRNRQGTVTDELTDRQMIYSWFKDICEVTKYLHDVGISDLVLDSFTSDKIFLTHENQIKVDVLECVIEQTLKTPPASSTSEISLTIDESTDIAKKRINTFPLGMHYILDRLN